MAAAVPTFRTATRRRSNLSVHDKIFALADDTLVYPGHDYQQRRVSNVGQEKARDPRLGGDEAIEEFLAIMAAPQPAAAQDDGCRGSGQSRMR